MINLERNGRVIAEDITAFEAFVKLALIDNFVFNDELSEQQLDEINEVYYELSNLDLNIGELDYLIYNITHIETLNDFLRVLVNHQIIRTHN